MTTAVVRFAARAVVSASATPVLAWRTPGDGGIGALGMALRNSIVGSNSATMINASALSVAEDFASRRYWGNAPVSAQLTRLGTQKEVEEASSSADFVYAVEVNERKGKKNHDNNGSISSKKDEDDDNNHHVPVISVSVREFGFDQDAFRGSLQEFNSFIERGFGQC